MPQIGRGATQDLVTGIPVETAANESGDAALLQLVVGAANKTTYSPTVRSGLAAVDTATDLSTSGFGGSGLIDLGNAAWLHVWGSCSSPNILLGYIVVLYDESDQPIDLVGPLTFTSSSRLRVSASGDYLATHGETPAALLLDVGTARKAKLYVTQYASGTWSLSARPC